MITILSIYVLFAIIQFGLVLKAVGQIDSEITSYKYKYKEKVDEYKLKYRNIEPTYNYEDNKGG